jgi:hypothetical protein
MHSLVFKGVRSSQREHVACARALYEHVTTCARALFWKKAKTCKASIFAHPFTCIQTQAWASSRVLKYGHIAAAQFDSYIFIYVACHFPRKYTSTGVYSCVSALLLSSKQNMHSSFTSSALTLGVVDFLRFSVCNPCIIVLMHVLAIHTQVAANVHHFIARSRVILMAFVVRQYFDTLLGLCMQHTALQWHMRVWNVELLPALNIVSIVISCLRKRAMTVMRSSRVFWILFWGDSKHVVSRSRPAVRMLGWFGVLKIK